MPILGSDNVPSKSNKTTLYFFIFTHPFALTSVMIFYTCLIELIAILLSQTREYLGSSQTLYTIIVHSLENNTR